MGSTKIQAAPPVDMGKVTADSIRARMEAESGTGRFADIGSIYNLESQYRPQWEGLELQSMQNMLGGVGGQQGLLSMYQNTVQPAMSQIESQAISDRTASEQAMIDKYGPGITDKLREAAGNKELIGQIVADASGEKDPELLNQMVADAQNAYGGQNVINQGPDVLASEVQGIGVNAPSVANTQGVTVDSVTGQTVQAPDIGQGRQMQIDPVTGQAVSAGPEAGYVQQGQNNLQPAIDAGLLQAGQQELTGGPSALDARINQEALAGLDKNLTKGEQRNFQQAVRQSQSARGMATAGMPSAAAEAFYLADRGADRRMQNLQFARSASSDLENRRVGRRGLGAGLIGQSYGQRMGAYQTDIGRSTGQQQLGLQAQGMNQQTDMQGQLANQAAQLQSENAMLSDQQARDLARANMGLQAQGMNQQTNMQGQLANQSAQLQAAGMNLSDQQARDLGRAQMGLQAGTSTADNLMKSQALNQQAGLTAQEANRQHGFNVQGANEANRFSQQQANRGYQSNVLGQLGSFTGNRFGRQMGAAQLAQGTSADPFLALFGRPSQSMSQMQGMGGQAYGMGQGSGPALFDPAGGMAQMGFQAAMQNNAVQNQVNMANAQSSNSMMSGLIGGAAALGGGMFAGIGAAAAGSKGGKSAWSNFWG